MVSAILVMSSLFWAAPPPPVPEPVEPTPLARVNGHEITMRDVERHLRLSGAAERAAPGGGALPVAEREEIAAERRRRALRELIERRLLYDAARAKYLAGRDAEDALAKLAEEELRKLERRVGSRLAARKLLAQAGLTVEEYKEMQLQNLLAAKLLWDEAHARARVAPAQVRRYYEEHRDEFVRPPAAVYRQVLFVVEEGGDEEAARAEAEQALAEVRSGRDPGELADALSADRDSYPGGLHEVELPEEGDWLPPAVRGLEPGGPAELRRVAGGWAIVRLEEVRPARPAPFEEAQALIRRRLLRRRRAAAQAEFIARLEEEGRVEYLSPAAEPGLPRETFPNGGP